MYKAMGAGAPIRIILIDGVYPEGRQVLPPRYSEIENLTSDMPGSAAIVKDWSVLVERIVL